MLKSIFAPSTFATIDYQSNFNMHQANQFNFLRQPIIRKPQDILKYFSTLSLWQNPVAYILRREYFNAESILQGSEFTIIWLRSPPPTNPTKTPSRQQRQKYFSTLPLMENPVSAHFMTYTYKRQVIPPRIQTCYQFILNFLH